MIDHYGRKIDYMRISITDRCNLHCRYCMPEKIEPVARSEILSYEEIVRVCQQSVTLGIHKIRLTGGEPLIRKNCTELVRMIKKVPGITEVTLTTNGVLLADYAEKLKASGIDAVNVSLDSTKREVMQKITGFDCLAQTLAGIKQAVRQQIPVKINCVLIKELNEGEWYNLIKLAKKLNTGLRFIELMPIGYGKNFAPVNNADILSQIRQIYGTVVPDRKKYGNGPARYFYIPQERMSIGFISAISNQFCSRCSRIRLTSQGFLKPCLCYEAGVNLKSILRNAGNEKLLAAISAAVYRKPFEHCFNHLSNITENNAMVKIGG